MCYINEIEETIKLLRANGCGEIKLLHCTTEYPAPFCDINLKAMLTLKNKFGVSVGYSDHSRGIEVPIAAVAMGATVIEKHFTLDRNMIGPDHKASIEPGELKEMVGMIRNVEKAIGNEEKVPANSEIKNITIARKSIVAKRNISKGELLTEDNLTTKRPGNGISPMKWNEVIGTKAVRDFLEDELINL
jgi:N,N'-diacetyllegionaminate synthase